MRVRRRRPHLPIYPPPYSHNRYKGLSTTEGPSMISFILRPGFSWLIPVPVFVATVAHLPMHSAPGGPWDAKGATAQPQSRVV